ncbi:MAG: hypothetical protein HZC28_08450 [Spirochaetes bacterium]|nr:hypothetical protein [Spirochaetota bacterium]
MSFLKGLLSTLTASGIAGTAIEAVKGFIESKRTDERITQLEADIDARIAEVHAQAKADVESLRTVVRALVITVTILSLVVLGLVVKLFILK